MKIIKIGRSSSNDVVIDDTMVSRTHCQIINDDYGNYRLIDLNSANGTYVNGERRHGEVRLNKSDIVRIGNSTLPWQSYFTGADGGPSMGGGYVSPMPPQKGGGFGVVSIGRSLANDIVINDRKVSRHHLQIIQDDHGNFRVSDFGSTNGTYINGMKIKGEVRLLPNDVVKVGNTVLPWRTYFDHQAQPEPTPLLDPAPTNSKGAWVLVLGLAALGMVAFIVINYFASAGNRLALTFGGVEASLKFFPIYLRGCLGISGQWFPMIAALILGVVADFVYDSNENDEDKLSSAGKAMANIAITAAVIFLLLAIFATKIAELIIKTL